MAHPAETGPAAPHCAAGRTRRNATGRPCLTTTMYRTISTRSGSIDRWSIRALTLNTKTATSTPPNAQARLRLQKAATPRRRAVARHRLWLGRLDHPCRTALRLSSRRAIFGDSSTSIGEPMHRCSPMACVKLETESKPQKPISTSKWTQRSNS